MSRITSRIDRQREEERERGNDKVRETLWSGGIIG